MDKNSLNWALWRHWLVIVALTVLGALVGALPDPSTAEDSPTAKSSWQAAHTLLVSSPSAGQSILNDPVTFSQMQLFATVGEVPARVAEILDFDGVPAALAAEVLVELRPDTGAMRFSTTQESGDEAVEIVDTFADVFTKYLSERQDRLREERIASNLARLDELEGEITPLERQLVDNPNDEIARSQLDALSRQYSVAFEQRNLLQQDQGQLVATTLESAQALESTTSERGLRAPRSRMSRGLLGAIVGAIAGLGVALLLSRVDRRLRTREQAEEVLNLQAQVSIEPTSGDDSKVVVTPDRHDSLSDSFRTLRSVIGFVDGGAARAQGRAPIVLVVSPGPGDGKTTVSSNLACAFVETGLRTIAVNADFRRPALTMRLTGARAVPSDFNLIEASSIPPQHFMRLTNTPGLAIVDLAGIPGGTPGNLARLTARSLVPLAEIADAVVIDSSPLGATAEVLEFIPAVDLVVMVVRIDHTFTDSAIRAIKVVRALTEVPVLLAVVGDSAVNSPYYYEYPTKDSRGRWRHKVNLQGWVRR